MVKAIKLNKTAKQRHQTLAQMAIALVLRNSEITSALVGASRVRQIEDSVAALDNLGFSDKELLAIDNILAG